MSKIANVVRSFAREDEGATMVEYAIMVALIAVVCIGAVVTLGANTNTTFGTAGTAVAS